jgi:hypothetical protein
VTITLNGAAQSSPFTAQPGSRIDVTYTTAPSWSWLSALTRITSPGKDPLK